MRFLASEVPLQPGPHATWSLSETPPGQLTDLRQALLALDLPSLLSALPLSLSLTHTPSLSPSLSISLLPSLSLPLSPCYNPCLVQSTAVGLAGAPDAGRPFRISGLGFRVYCSPNARRVSFSLLTGLCRSDLIGACCPHSGLQGRLSRIRNNPPPRTLQYAHA